VSPVEEGEGGTWRRYYIRENALQAVRILGVGEGDGGGMTRVEK